MLPGYLFCPFAMLSRLILLLLVLLPITTLATPLTILADEWPARRDAIEAWLDDANWDGAGRPRASLHRTPDGGNPA